MQSYLLVAVGGAVGAAMRHGLSRALPPGASGLPWATLAANATGGLLIGLLAGYVLSRGEGAESWRLLLGVGLLGGFTTFSAFSLEVVMLMERGKAPVAALYVAASIVLAIAAAGLGLWAGRRWFA
jgi:fluoride exporter